VIGTGRALLPRNIIFLLLYLICVRGCVIPRPPRKILRLCDPSICEVEQPCYRRQSPQRLHLHLHKQAVGLVCPLSFRQPMDPEQLKLVPLGGGGSPRCFH
jgi:hypothetical protein